MTEHLSDCRAALTFEETVFERQARGLPGSFVGGSEILYFDHWIPAAVSLFSIVLKGLNTSPIFCLRSLFFLW